MQAVHTYIHTYIIWKCEYRRVGGIKRVPIGCETGGSRSRGENGTYTKMATKGREEEKKWKERKREGSRGRRRRTDDKKRLKEQRESVN